MKFIKSTFITVLMLGLWMPALVSAQQATSLKIGVVNVPRLLQESPQARAAMEALQDEFAPRQREIVAAQTTLKDEQAKFQNDIDVMGEEERRNKERELRNDERTLVRDQNEFEEDINLRRNEELGKMQQELARQIQNYAKQEGYDLILGEGVLYISGTIDITQQILQGLEESFNANAG
ncbi:MAG: OmpH family outer membrane protein [Gammaproteobacteria bacterium]